MGINQEHRAAKVEFEKFSTNDLKKLWFKLLKLHSFTERLLQTNSL